MDKPAGINAANESITAGGTPSGNLITSFFLTAKAKISVEIIATIIAKKIPLVPKLPNAKPENILPSAFTNAGCFIGVIIKNATRATIADAILSTFFSRAYAYAIPITDSTA